MSASGTTYDSITAKSKSADPFHDAVTSSLITPHSIAQMQNLLDSLDHTSKSSKDNLLSFFVQSMFQSFLPPDLKHVAMGANTQLPLVQNMSTRDGNCCLVKDQWALPDNARPNQTSIHLRFACPLELINRRITDWSRLEEFMNALQDVTKGLFLYRDHLTSFLYVLSTQPTRK
ncbi:hypothetical protein C0993_008012 [Termitomyces sp. T159_Od127]|nr:hypothetical protein C0993_008012 [Termitomyces sp. T159_Od127]